VTKDLFVCGATGMRCESELPAPPLVWPELAPKTTCNAAPRHETSMSENSRLEPAPLVWPIASPRIYDEAGRVVAFPAPAQRLFTREELDRR
jgi:hypothetical protein